MTLSNWTTLQVAGRGGGDPRSPRSPPASSKSSGGRLIVAMLRAVGTRRLRCSTSLASRLMRRTSSGAPAAGSSTCWSPRRRLRRCHRRSASSSVDELGARCRSNSLRGGSSMPSGRLLARPWPRYSPCCANRIIRNIREC